MENYNVAVNDKDAKMKILQGLLQEYKNVKEGVFENITNACQAAARLEQIGLGTSFLTSVVYIERLIESEQQSKRSNKSNRYLYNYEFFA